MLTSLTLKFGANPTSQPLEVVLAPVTVFVGPNNGGKSLALTEIESIISTPSMTSNQPARSVVDAVEFEAWEIAHFEALIEGMAIPDASTGPHTLLRKIDARTSSAIHVQVEKESLCAEARDPNRYRQQYATLLGICTLRLDGANRLAMAAAQPTGNLKQPAENHLAFFFRDDHARAALSEIVQETFGKYLVLDPTNVGTLEWRLSSRKPATPAEERGLDDAAIHFHLQATPLTKASDGVRAFVGILSTILACEPQIILIDEPEAFLHPTLSSRLGKEVAGRLTPTQRLFVSTHSAAFLMGCIQSGRDISIVRLTYDNDRGTARLLPPAKLAQLMKQPLLRSVGVLDSLFHSCVVVTEGDSDRAFYQEVNERMLAASDRRGIRGCAFLNAQNKQTLSDIIRPLRELGVPAAAIADLDVLKEGGAAWKKLLGAAFVPELRHKSLQELRREVAAELSAGEEIEESGGVDVLPSSGDPKNARAACLDLIQQLAEYGVFVVERGSLEDWLKDLGVSKVKKTWLASMFTAMGANAGDDSYVHPGKGDVWDFVGGIASWVMNPGRKGVP